MATGSCAWLKSGNVYFVNVYQIILVISHGYPTTNKNKKGHQAPRPKPSHFVVTEEAASGAVGKWATSPQQLISRKVCPHSSAWKEVKSYSYLQASEGKTLQIRQYLRQASLLCVCVWFNMEFNKIDVMLWFIGLEEYSSNSSLIHVMQNTKDVPKQSPSGRTTCKCYEFNGGKKKFSLKLH